MALGVDRCGSIQDHSVPERSVWYALLMLGRISSHRLETPFRTVSALLLMRLGISWNALSRYEGVLLYLGQVASAFLAWRKVKGR